MKKHVLTALFLGLLTPALAFAQSDFNGTWKVNLNKSKLSTKPDVYLLIDGTYTCKTCVPELVVFPCPKNPPTCPANPATVAPTAERNVLPTRNG